MSIEIEENLYNYTYLTENYAPGPRRQTGGRMKMVSNEQTQEPFCVEEGLQGNLGSLHFA